MDNRIEFDEYYGDIDFFDNEQWAELHLNIARDLLLADKAGYTLAKAIEQIGPKYNSLLPFKKDSTKNDWWYEMAYQKTVERAVDWNLNWANDNLRKAGRKTVTLPQLLEQWGLTETEAIQEEKKTKELMPETVKKPVDTSIDLSSIPGNEDEPEVETVKTPSGDNKFLQASVGGFNIWWLVGAVVFTVVLVVLSRKKK